MSANDEQVGGKHYFAEYQHWDWCVDCRLGYLESAATKYIARQSKKNGVEDLGKARHYLLKAAECWDQGRYVNGAIYDLDCTQRFFRSNQHIPVEDYSMFYEILGWSSGRALRRVAAKLADRVQAAQGAAGGQGAAPLVGYGGTPKVGAGGAALPGACGWCAAPLPGVVGRCPTCGSMQYPFGFTPEEERS